MFLIVHQLEKTESNSSDTVLLCHFHYICGVEFISLIEAYLDKERYNYKDNYNKYISIPTNIW